MALDDKYYQNVFKKLSNENFNFLTEYDKEIFC